MMKKSPPYLYESFNLFSFITYDNRVSRNILTRILNAMIEGFNRREHLPKYVLLVLDKNLIEAATEHYNTDYGIKEMLSKWVTWIWKMLDRLIEIRKQDLFAKRPGAVGSKDPKVIWIKMIDRPHVLRPDPRFKVLSIRPKFNDAIDEITQNKRNNFCLGIDSLEARHFGPNGELNDFGSLQYWKELDYYFKKFDRREIPLPPIAPRTTSRDNQH